MSVCVGGWFGFTTELEYFSHQTKIRFLFCGHEKSVSFNKIFCRVRSLIWFHFLSIKFDDICFPLKTYPPFFSPNLNGCSITYMKYCTTFFSKILVYLRSPNYRLCLLTIYSQRLFIIVHLPCGHKRNPY